MKKKVKLTKADILLAIAFFMLVIFFLFEATFNPQNIEALFGLGGK